MFLTESDVRQLLPMQDAIRLVREAFEKLGRGEAINQPRRRLILPTGSALHYMAAGEDEFFGAKVYATHPRHGARFIFLLYRAEDAELLAVIQANWLGQIRTGATTGFATDLMARPDAATVGMIGTGFQARSQLEAVATVRRLTSVKVWGRSPEKRAAFAREYSEKLCISVTAVDTAREAVNDTRIVITATNAHEPVLEYDWLTPGAHINAMGSNHPRHRELPGALIRKADCLAVDSLEQARMEAGDLLLELGTGDWAGRPVVELQELAAARAAGRTKPTDITVFKSLGLAVEDVVAAGFVYRKAVESGLGRRLGPAHS